MKLSVLFTLIFLVVAAPSFATTYTYTISEDVPAGTVTAGNLASEIISSAITTELSYVNTAGDTLSVIFAGTLSAGDKTLLDGDTTNPCGGLIGAHDPTPEEGVDGWVKSRQVSEITTTTSSWADVLQRGHRVEPGWYQITLSYLGATDSSAQLITMQVNREGAWKFGFQDSHSGGIANFSPRTFTYLYEETGTGWKVWDLDWRRSGDAGTIKAKFILLLIERLP